MQKFNLAEFFKKMDKNTMFLGIAVIAVIILGVLMFGDKVLPQGLLDKIKISGFGGQSKEALAKKAIDHINSNVLTGGQTASLNSVSEESGLVKINITIAGSTFDSYISKDGKLLFPEAIRIDGGNSEGQTNQNTTNQQATSPTPSGPAPELAKVDKPLVEAYVVSKCPFGLQMQRVFSDIVQNAPELAQNLKVRYIGSVSNGVVTAMHGDPEAQENLRQICIRDEQGSKYWNYVSCHIKAGDVAGCLSSTGIDTNKLNSCMSDKNKGIVYAQKDFDLNTKYGIQGSPTLIVEGKEISEFSFGGRASEAIKKIICQSYKNPPDSCNKILNTAEAATSFSPVYSSGAPSSNSGSNSGSVIAPNCAPAT